MGRYTVCVYLNGRLIDMGEPVNMAWAKVLARSAWSVWPGCEVSIYDPEDTVIEPWFRRMK